MAVLSRMARHWIAGENLPDAVSRAKELNRKGIKVIINYLGEHVKKEREAVENYQEAVRMLEAIKNEKIEGCISVKLSQIGLDIDKEYCYDNLGKIVMLAGELGLFIWIDMEGSKYTQDTLDLYYRLLNKFSNVGIVIQANLRRSMDDVKNLVTVRAGGNPAVIRLVKGAYAENAEIAFKKREDVTANFSKIMALLFEKSNRFAIATHDDRLIKEALELNKTWNRNIEFQLLLGVRSELKKELVSQGYTVFDYVPYGKNWLPYSVRRIREKKSNIILLLRSLFD